MKSFFKKYRNIIGIVIIVLAIGGALLYIGSATPPTFGSTTVTKGNVVESVDEAGSVLAENSAAISFQVPGQIAHVYVSEGNQVAAGTVLVDLDSAQLSAAVQQANAGLAAAQAQLDQLTSGTRAEQLAIDQSAVASADRSLGIAVGNGYSAADDAVRNQLDVMFSNPQGSNPTFLVSNNNSQSVNSISNQRFQIGAALTQWYAALNATSSQFDPASLSAMSSGDLQKVSAYINLIALVVNDPSQNSTLSPAALAQYKGAVATARAEIQGSITAVSSNQSALTAAQNVLTLAQAGATSQQIAAQTAAVAAAQAAATSARVALDHASLVAPFSGTVQNLTAQVGQVMSPGAPMMSLINNGGLKVQAYVSEKDVAKIAPGDAATVTLDAFGTGTTFPATVTTIDAAQTQVNGTAAYMVTLHFTKPDGRLKDGMTGNVRIIAAEHDNVATVPSNLVINDGNNYFVLAKNGGVIVKKSVTIGLVGDGGMTEILSGLNVGDSINNF